MADLKEEILQCCFGRFKGTLSNGDPANNKIDLDLLSKNPELLVRCVTDLGRLALDFRPDFVTAVPNGATWLAEAIAAKHNLELIKLFKYPDNGEIDFYSKEDEALSQSISRGVLIEDVARTLYNMHNVLALPELEKKFIGACAVFDRGDPNRRRSLPIPFRSLVSYYIPPVLLADSRLWSYAYECN